MPLRLLRFGLGLARPDTRILPLPQELKPHYDVVIVGGGGHGLAAAYYLARQHGITNVAVLDKGYIGGGNTGRNTAIVRSNYLTDDGVRFYAESMRLYQTLSDELDINLMYSQRGHLTLAHTDASIRTMRWRAEVNKHLGVASELIGPDEVARICPQLNLSRDVRYPILGALYHPVGATVRHDAVAWGYARAAGRLGVAVHQGTEVVGFTKEGGRITAVETTRGRIGCGKVLIAVAGRSSLLCDMAGFRLPIRTVPLQACVSQPVKRFLDPIIVSGSLHCYIWQSQRGELVMGGATDPYPLYSTRSTLDFKEGLMAHMLELLPFLGEVKIMRQWAGLSDMTPDFAPVMGKTPLSNCYLTADWGTWGFKATPASGKAMAACVADDRPPELIAPFRLDRFRELDQLGEAGAASVGH